MRVTQVQEDMKSMREHALTLDSLRCANQELNQELEARALLHTRRLQESSQEQDERERIREAESARTREEERERARERRQKKSKLEAELRRSAGTVQGLVDARCRVFATRSVMVSLSL
jgi:hypothetical protein